MYKGIYEILMAILEEILILDQKDLTVIRDETESPVLLNVMAETFKVLSDPTRLKIVFALLNRELCVRDLAIATELTQPAVSYHLKTLRQLNLVDHRKQGKLTFYSLADAHVSELLAIAREHAGEIL